MPAILVIVSIIAATLLGMSNPFGGGQNQTGDSWVTPADNLACQPNIDNNRTIKIEVDPSVSELYANDSKPQFDKRNDEWVLIKTAAPIPAWKLNRNNEASGGKTYSELEKMGTAQDFSNPTNPDNGKDTYIGIGWCDPDTGESYGWGEVWLGRNGCLDPLTQDVLFVVDHEGALGFGEDEWLNDPDWPNDENAEPPHTQENLDKYWWKFNVYYKKSLLPASPTVNDLPCWIRELANQCPGAGDVRGDNRVAADEANNCAPNPTSNVLAATDTPIDPRATLHKGTDGLVITTSVPGGATIADDYLFVKETTIAPSDPIIGTAYRDHFDARIRLGDVEGTGTDHTIILDATRQGRGGTYYIYAPILGTSQPDGASTLQLGSFVPGIPSFFYEWWTPACKPAIYLYPEKETEIAVIVKPEGFITKSIPEHGENGWNVLARPNGSLFSTTTREPLDLGYLYYEASIKKVDVSKTHGWIRTREELPAFFSSTLTTLGLNAQERYDFLEYWIPKLQDGEKWFITLIDRTELDRVEPIEFSKEPDNFIRVRFYFEKLDGENTNKFLNVASYQLATPSPRSGFTAVDWGGMIGNGSCGIEEISK